MYFKVHVHYIWLPLLNGRFNINLHIKIGFIFISFYINLSGENQEYSKLLQSYLSNPLLCFAVCS